MLTQNADVANSVIDENAWVKLNPLWGTFQSTVDPLRDPIPEDTGHYPHPTWNVIWTRNELCHLVTSRYGERMLQLITVRDGMAPVALLFVCERHKVQWRARALPGLQPI